MSNIKTKYHANPKWVSNKASIIMTRGDITLHYTHLQINARNNYLIY